MIALRPGDFAVRGMRALHLGMADRWPEALRDVDAAVARVPHGHPAELDMITLRAMVRREMGMLPEALADLDMLVPVRPLAGDLAARGEVRRRLGDLAGALEDQDRAIEMCETDPFAFICRGRVHLAGGRIEAAIQDFDTALQLDPEGGIAAHHHRARARRTQGDETGARADWDAALGLARGQLARDPRDTRARMWIAWIHAEGLGEGLDEALELMEQIRSEVRNFDQRADLIETLARVHFRLGNLEEALRLEEQSHALVPTDVEILARLEEVRRAIGEV